MPDAMDRLQQFNDDAVSDALQRHADRPRAPGLTACENLDCREPIPPARTELGARLCIDCQRAEEAASAHLGGWRRGR